MNKRKCYQPYNLDSYIPKMKKNNKSWFLFIVLLLVTIVSCSPTSNSTNSNTGFTDVKPTIEPAALVDANRYLSMLQAKWSGTQPGSIVGFSDMKDVQEYSWGYEFTYIVTYYNGLEKVVVLEIKRNSDGTFSAIKLRQD